MFFKKSTLALAFVALASLVSAGQPPACLLSVMGNTSNPDDLAAICGANAQQVESDISSKCGDKAQSALTFFANTCNAAGHKVDISTASSTATKGSGNANTTTGSGFVTAVSTSGSQATGSSSSGASGTASGTASGSASGSASASAAVHTGAAASDRQLSGTAFAAAVFLGAAALL